MNIIANGIAMAPGKQLDEYARARGLCRLCGQTQTHRKAGRFLKKLRGRWQPITVEDEARGTYLVYKGYCIQPTCYSLDDAKTKLGEKPSRRMSATDQVATASRPPLSCRRSDSSQIPSHPSSPFKTKSRPGSGKISDMMSSSTISNTSGSLYSDEEEAHGQNPQVFSLNMGATFGVPISIDSLSQMRSKKSNSDSSKSDTTFCADINGCESARPASILKEESEDAQSLERKFETDDSTIGSALSEAGDDVEDSSVDSDESQHVPEEGTLSLASLLPLPSLNINVATSISTGLVRSASFRNAVEALDLASPSQHQRLLEGSDEDVVCLNASGSEQVGFETVAWPITRGNSLAIAATSEECSSMFEATELGIEVSLDSSQETDWKKPIRKSNTQSTRYDLEKEIEKCKLFLSAVDDRSTFERSRQKRRLVKLVALRDSMPTTQELQQRITELDIVLRDLTGSQRTSFDDERQTKQNFLERELEREGEETYSDQNARYELKASTLRAPPYSDPTYRLTLFQAAPLSYFDRNTNGRHLFPILDFEYESRVLKQALKDAETMGTLIEIEHEIATTDRLSAFFAQGGRRLLHLSCHGHPKWLALENGFGDMQPLFVEDLKGFIEAGGTSLDLVFVSACHSLPAGEAFLEAGVRHVVCAKQDSAFRDEACAEFARCFYRALACKKTLKQAFMMAKESVRLSPLVTNARIESDKFLLLPKCDDDSYHDVVISFADHRTRSEDVVRHTYEPRILKRVPINFLGREADMYRILEALRSADLVQVIGGLGTGKSTLVAAVSKYILQRTTSFMMDGAVWLPNAVKGDGDETAKLLNYCTSLIADGKISILERPAYRDVIVHLFEALDGKRVLLVFDVRCFGSQQAVKNLEFFLGNLLQALPAKIILIGNRALKVKLSSRVIEVGPLNHESSAILFSRLVHSERFPGPDLAKTLAPRRSSKEGRYPSKRNTVIFEKIGRGLPSEIEQAAAQMSETELLDLVRISKRPCPQVETRVALEDQIKRKLAEEAAALRKRHFMRARDIRDSIEELQGLRQYLKTIEQLTMEVCTLQMQLDKATKTRKYSTADQIQRQLESLEKQIHEEQRCHELFKEERFEEIRRRVKEGKVGRRRSNLQTENVGSVPV